MNQTTISISAETHSDDHKVEIDFDATPWFEQARDREILDLIAINYGGNLASDEVAEYFKENETKRLFDYLAFGPTMGIDETVGFECHVNADEAEAWIKKHRPHLLPKTYLFTVQGGFDAAGTLEEVVAANGDIVGLKTKDGRIIRLVLGFEIEESGSDYTYVCGDDNQIERLGIDSLEYDRTDLRLDDAD